MSTSPPKPAPEKALTPKELKDKKKAEKQARREQTKARVTPAQHQQQAKKKITSQQDGPVSTIRLGTNAPPSKRDLPVIVKEVPVETPAEPRDMGLVGILKDIESEQNGKKKNRIFGIENAHPDVHPAILTLGIQINKNVIVGSSARCLAFLVAIKRVWCRVSEFGLGMILSDTAGD